MASAGPLTQIDGWLVLFHPIFDRHYLALLAESRRLKERLSPDAYKRHGTVKLAAAVTRLIGEIVPGDPNLPEFQLRGHLSPFRRAKGHGLPPRYRLFWTFSQQAKVIIILYLNGEATLRKEGAGSDPYAVFARMVARGEIGADFAANFAMLREHDGDEARQSASTNAPREAAGRRIRRTAPRRKRRGEPR